MSGAQAGWWLVRHLARRRQGWPPITADHDAVVDPDPVGITKGPQQEFLAQRYELTAVQPIRHTIWVLSHVPSGTP